MRRHSVVLFVLFAAITVLSGTKSLRADPGMWPFNMLPVEEIKRKYGVDLSQEFLDTLMYSMARINSGGSAAFVSPDGLLITNHHVAQSALRQISKPDGFNYAEHGFTAKNRAEEIRIPSYEVNALIGIEDVTDRVNSKVTPEMTPFEAKKMRDRTAAEIEQEFFKATGQKPQVVGMFRDTVYHLYKFTRYRDVRLAWAPEKQAGFFGDDEANFHFPRYALDAALFRVYDEKGEPVKTPFYVPISPYGAQEEELLFIAGNPGTTKRHFTSIEMAFERDVNVPFTIEVLEGREKAMLQLKSHPDKEVVRMATDEVFSIQNGLKVYRGMVDNFRFNQIIEKKAESEAASLEALKKLGRGGEWQEAMGKIEQAQKAYADLYDQLRAIGSIGLNSEYFAHAGYLVDIVEQSRLENVDREKDYRDANRPSLDLEIDSEEAIYAPFEEQKLIQSLSWAIGRYGNKLPAILLNGKSVEERAKELSQSKILGDPKKRRELFNALEKGEITLESIDDPWIPLVRAIREASKKLDEKIANEISGPTRDGFKTILDLRRSLGEQLYPDATFSPRVTYGTKKPYVDHGILLPTHTTMGQAFVQAESRDNKGFWELPKSWWDALKAGRIDTSTPFNFVSQHDTIGGNSGSPMVSRHGYWVGILFDGTRFTSGQVTHAEPNPKIGRSVSVDCRAVLAALDGIYMAGYLMDEVQGAWRLKIANSGSKG